MNTIVNLFSGYNVVIAASSTILAGIVAAVFIARPAYISTIVQWFDTIRTVVMDFFINLLNNSPKALKIMMFLGLMLIFANVLGSFIFSSFVICDKTGEEYSPKIPIVSPFLMNIVITYQTAFNGTQFLGQNVFLADDNPILNPSKYVSPRLENPEDMDFINVGCVKEKSTLLLGTLDIFDYKLWLMGVVAGAVIIGVIRIKGGNI